MAPGGAARSSPQGSAEAGPLPDCSDSLDLSPRLTPDIPVIHRRIRAIRVCANRKAWPWWHFATRDGLPATEESSATRPPRKRAVSFGTQATEAVDGSSKKKREASADPTFFEGPAAPEPSGLRTAKGKPSGFAPTGTRIGSLRGSDWEPTEVARPRPEPEPPRKDARPHRRRGWTRDKWGLVATPAPILFWGKRRTRLPPAQLLGQLAISQRMRSSASISSSYTHCARP